jgi:class 3 adenylate cyclase/tetratricopeptide (TPR) repeat protein
MLVYMTERLCRHCGAPLPEEARFCPRCGTPVIEGATEERKVVTILFADLAGSTELAAQLDPERFREVIAAFYKTASLEVESLRGRVEKFIGDAVMAVFGLPHAHEDDALRAVRAALFIRDETARLGESLGLPMALTVRVGVNSGAVATGSGPSDQFLVSGVAVNLAARLQTAAEPGEVLVGDTTWQLTRRLVEYGPVRTIEARGFEEEIAARPVVSLSSRSSRRTIPLVDRRRELALLVDMFERARDTRRAHVVTILGEPGIGKSRLVDEFTAGLPEEAKVLKGRASEFEEDPTLAPIADMIRSELGLERDSPATQVRKALEDVVTGCCDPTEVQKVVARLGLALGLGLGPGEGPVRIRENLETEGRERHRYRSAEVRSGVQALIAGMGRSGPVVMVFEDLHAARPDLLDMVEQILRSSRRVPLVVVCVARDELLEARPGWGGGLPDAVTVRLDPLGPKEARDLAVAAGESLDDMTAERIAQQTGGNPFFIIETTGMLLQRHQEHLIGASHSHLLPPTVQAVVASRIDHLPPEARDLLRKASVFARSTFSNAELSLIAPAGEDLLGALEDEEFLVRDPDRPGLWQFRHQTLRDVAYESLPKRERMRLHVQVAEGIEATRDGERFPQVVAYHLAQAARASLDLNPNDRSLADRAVVALARAADLARWRMESRTAADLYEQALELAGPEKGWGKREARILSGLGEARYWQGEFRQARDTLSRALDVGGADAWTRTHAYRFLGDIALNLDGDPDRATLQFDQALSAARELADPYAMARTLLMAGWAPYWRRDIEGCRKMFEEALEIARTNPEKDTWAEARALVSLTSATSPIGSEEECLPLAQQALALGREMDDPFTVAVAEEAIGNTLRRMLRLDEALPAIEEAVRVFRELGARWELASAVGDRGEIRRHSGQLREAERDFREAFDLCLKLGERSLVQWTAGQLIRVYLAKGERKAAQRVLDDPAAWPEAGDSGSKGARLLAEALTALADGDRVTGLERSLQILEMLKADGWPNPLAAWTWWTGNVFGPDAVGGADALEAALRTLEAARWLAAIKDPELVALSEPSTR